jgi:endoribonuclease LACTB2
VRQACAIVLFSDDDIFVVRRQNHLPSFPGYTSFPGGLIDLKDHDPAPLPGPLQVLPHALARAVERELYEELGVDLFSSVPIYRVKVLGEAITPSFNPYRFATTFVAIELAHRVDFTLDPGELESGGWHSPRALKEQYNQGELLVVPPTYALIDKLIEAGGWPSSENMDLNLVWNQETHVPLIEPLHQLRQLMPLSNTLPPATRTNCFVVGPIDRCFLIDPSPKDESEYLKLLKTLEGLNIIAMLITHHHPDHHERADQLARELRLPVFMSRDTHERIQNKWPETFQNLEISYLKAGDLWGEWLGENLVVHEVPGHDEGQLALAPPSLKWFLVGDLVQTHGTIVIAAPEGDMGKYMESLERVIALGPAVIVPSHGIAMGGVFKLTETLKHRRYREDQIRELAGKKLNLEEILVAVYPDLKQELLPLARVTIESHLRKIQAE